VDLFTRQAFCRGKSRASCDRLLFWAFYAMRLLVVPFLGFLPLLCSAGEDCTFDEAHQAKVINSIAARFSGGAPNVPDRMVTWTSVTEGTTTLSYGGCYDLGSMITRSTPLTNPRTQNQVFALARELALMFWSNDIVSARLATKTLLAGLDGATYIVEETNGRILFSVLSSSYVELHVEHEYKDGIDRVEISWQGNF
jgi:hypothetical protein